MNKIKVIVSIILAIALLVPVSSLAFFDDIDEVCVEYSTPVLDGAFDKADGWSNAILLDNSTLAIISHNKQNAIDMNANAYMAYDDTNLYFGAEITEFGEGMSIDDLRCPSVLTEAVDGGNYGFDGDVFGITIDPMSKLSSDPERLEEYAPFYCVGFDEEGNGAVYHSNGTADEILSPDAAQVSVVLTEAGWNFEAAVSWDIVIADMCHKLGVDELTYDEYRGFFYGNLDGKANFVYKSNRFDLEAQEIITYAEYASVAESSIDGYPGNYLYGTPVKTFGITYYLNHEHSGKGYCFDGEEGFATFDKEGTRYYVCDTCFAAFDKHTVPVIPFTDVKPGQWYENALIRSYNWEYFNGMSATKFAPNVSMTRAMFVQVIANFWGVDTSEYSCDQFTDVKPNHWYYGAVAWAYEEGITSGTSKTKFSPNKPLSREEAATLFANVIKADDLYEEPTIEFDAKYTDTGKIADWAKESMLWAIESGIISGTSGTTLAPRGNATRMQVAQMLCKFEDHVISLLTPDVVE